MQPSIFSAYASQFENLKQSFTQGIPHHGWILTGPKGIGKTQFAEAFSAFLLGGNFPFPEELWHSLQSNSHPNFLKVAPLDEKAQGITVDQIRALKDFAQKTAPEGLWKIILINSLNDLGLNAANALLKILEEPQPKTLFFLIFHSGEILLPTLRSRCALIPFHPPVQAVPSSIADAIAAGRPQFLAQFQLPEFQSLLTQIFELLATPSLNYALIYPFIQSAYRDAEKFESVIEILQWWLVNLIKSKSKKDLPFQEIFAAWQSLPLSEILMTQQKIQKLLNDQKTLNLDKRHTLLGFFFGLNNLANTSLPGKNPPNRNQ